MVRALAIILFANSAVTAFCLAMMAAMYATGDLPFGLKPLYSYAEKKTVGKSQNNQLSEEQNPAGESFDYHSLIPERANEKILADFYEGLKKEKQQYLLDRRNLDQEKLSLNEISERFAVLEQNLLKKQQELEALLTRITEEEQANVKKISNLLLAMEGGNAVKILLQQDDQMAARVLYMMDDKKAGVLIGGILNDPAGMERMKKIYKIMHKLTLKKLKADKA